MVVCWDEHDAVGGPLARGLLAKRCFSSFAIVASAAFAQDEARGGLVAHSDIRAEPNGVPFVASSRDRSKLDRAFPAQYGNIAERRSR